MNIKTYLAVLTATVTLIITSPANVHAQNESPAKHHCDRNELGALSTNISGRSILCTSSTGLRAHMLANGMHPKDAYTVWWVYFDDPNSCEIPGQCGLIDFEGVNPLGVFGRMDSLVAGASGRGSFRGSLSGFHPASGSQVWFLMFGHGPMDTTDTRHLARQLLTPEDPNAGAPHLGNTEDGSLGYPAAITVFQF